MAQSDVRQFGVVLLLGDGQRLPDDFVDVGRRALGPGLAREIEERADDPPEELRVRLDRRQMVAA